MNTKSKIVSLNALKKHLALWRRKKKHIAFTNGCFDILHAGHVGYLEQAKKDDRILVLGLNSDKSIRSIKGKDRPIVAQKYRARLLAALACIDYVVLFDEDTPQVLIEQVKPDVMIKGADWKGKDVAGAKFVQSYGGRVEFIKHIDSLSTTNVIETILKKCPK